MRVISKNLLGVLVIFLIVFLGACNNKTSTPPSEAKNTKASHLLGSSEAIESALNSSETKLFRRELVNEFYTNRNFKPAWNSPALRSALVDTLRGAISQGLYFKDYHGPQLEKLNAAINTLNGQQQSELDLLFTDAFLKFADHLYNGKTNPEKLHEIWDVKKEKLDLAAMLEMLLPKNDLESALKTLRPTNPIYNSLIAAEKEYRELSKNSAPFKKIESGELIKPGTQDRRIQDIQFRLLALGYLENLKIGSFTYSEDVVEAVKKIQEDYGLSLDGNIGDETIELLNFGYEERYNQILVNLERWRWYPRDLGEHYILINIPAYTLDLIKNDDTIRSHKIMVGTGARKTPIFSEDVEYLILNPDWNIPPTIKTKDVLPGVRKNPEYLAKKNIEVFDAGGNQLNPDEIDWNGKDVKKYKFKQAPGSSNPLGKVKIIYPNEYLIYLHDTPSKSLFGKNSRAQSSGCIRVQDAMELAEYLIEDQPEITSKYIDSILQSGVTKRINLKQDIKVHHFYWTAWRENGKTRFVRDIYKYDDRILEALLKSS